MKLVGKCSILRMKPKKDIEYPLIRLPKEYKDLIGKEAIIYEIDKNKFLISVDENLDIELYNWLYNQLDFSRIDKNLLQKAKELKINLNSILEEKLKEILNSCGGRDSNPRTPTGGDLESPAFGHSATPAVKKNGIVISRKIFRMLPFQSCDYTVTSTCGCNYELVHVL